MAFLSLSGRRCGAIGRASVFLVASAVNFGCSSSGDAAATGAGGSGNADAATSGGMTSGNGGSSGANGGASGASGRSGGGGANGGASGSTGAPYGCDNATVYHVSNGPMSSPDDTGFDLCGSSFVARRRAAMDCPLGPTTTASTCTNHLCSSDADCNREPHGYCAESRRLSGYCGCYYGCMKDSDCGAGNICFCGTPVGHCVPATCMDDSSCGAGQLCATYLAPCVPGTGGTGIACTGAPNGCFSGFACQSAKDECLGNDDCPSTKPRCELQGDHRACAPECQGPPTP